MSFASVGVDVGGTSTRAVRFDEALRPGPTSIAPTPSGAEPIAAIAARLVADVMTGSDAPLGVVAMGIPGRVDAATASVSSAVNLGITEPVAMGALLAARVGVPVHLENDVNAAALGAFAWFRLAATQSLAYVNVGTGIAAGFVLGGRLWRGATGGAGEIGHVPMRSGEPACPCGQIGCAEAVGSGRAVAEDPSRRRHVIGAVAWTVQLCVMTLDVDVVVVGGGMTSAGDELFAALTGELADREAGSPMLGAVGLARRVVLAPADVPLGSLGAVLALDEREIPS